MPSGKHQGKWAIPPKWAASEAKRREFAEMAGATKIQLGDKSVVDLVVPKGEVVCRVTVDHPEHGFQTVLMPEKEALRLLATWPYSEEG